MTHKEFKAWFEGFTEALGGLPTVTQWNMIKEKVSKIDAAPDGQQFLYRGPALIGAAPLQGAQLTNGQTSL